MKKLIVASALALMSAQGFASVIVKEGYRIDDPHKRFLPQLKIRSDFSFDHVNSQGYTIYGPEGLGQWLEMNNIPAAEDVIFHEDEKGATVNGYMSHEDLGKLMQSFGERFPKIAKVESLGKSVQGRELWVIKISKNVEIDEIEPEFKYIANMHGDEITGRDVSLKFIADLLENYGKDERITRLIDNTEIYIVPTMNPDGMTARRRGNANYVDLNRDFPSFGANATNSPDRRAIETQHVMRFQAGRHFSLSGNFHGGAVCVNYPWDTIRELHPLNNLFYTISKEYADTNSEMRSSTEFENGITNGYAWYQTTGGMQDWSTYWHNDSQVTFEISEIKWVDVKKIDYYYNDNRESMINYMSRIHQGAGLKFQDKAASGKIKVLDSKNKNLGEFSFTGGEFYKVLDPGNYTYVVTSGRMTKNIPVTVTEEFIPGGNFVTVETKR